jgi:hypothetical protein
MQAEQAIDGRPGRHLVQRRPDHRLKRTQRFSAQRPLSETGRAQLTLDHAQPLEAKRPDQRHQLTDRPIQGGDRLAVKVSGDQLRRCDAQQLVVLDRQRRHGPGPEHLAHLLGDGRAGGEQNPA